MPKACARAVSAALPRAAERARAAVKRPRNDGYDPDRAFHGAVVLRCGRGGKGSKINIAGKSFAFARAWHGRLEKRRNLCVFSVIKSGKYIDKSKLYGIIFMI